MTAILHLPGSFNKHIPSTTLKPFFSDIKKKYNLKDIEISNSSITLSGSPKSILLAVYQISYDDILMIAYLKISSPNHSSHEFTTETIRREIRRAKTERFSKSLKSHGFEECYGDMPWRFITAKTSKLQEAKLISRMEKCAICSKQANCAAMSILRAAKEKQLNSDY